MFFSTDKERQQAEEIRRLKERLARVEQKKVQKTRYVTKCCKLCGYRVTYIASGITPGTTCPRRKSGQPHIWQTLGYQYK